VTLVSPFVRAVAALAPGLLLCAAFADLTAGSRVHAGARITTRKADTKGGVLIVMYHNFGSAENRYTRSYRHFREDLENFYSLGFRPVTMSQYLANRMPLPPGASPVVITMDDSAPTQFAVDRKGRIDPHCAVGMWRAFAKTHPDFPVRGTFYVLPPIMWDQHAWRHHKVRLLKTWGSELACHTWSHRALRYQSDDSAAREYGRSSEFLKGLGFPQPSLAFPYGIYPRHMALLKGFKWKGKKYKFTGAVTCNPDLAPYPSFASKHPYELNRIEARRGYLALDYWMPEFKRNLHRLYVMP